MASTESDSAETRKGPLGILLGLLIKPRATMRYLGDARRRWWLLPALLVIATVVFQGVTYASSNAEYLYQRQQASREALPPAQQRQSVEAPSRPVLPPLVVGVRVGGRALGTVITWAVWAGLLLLMGTFFGQNGASFGAFFAMVTWAWLPYAVRNLLQGVYMALTNEPIYNQGLSGLVVDSAPPVMTSSFQPYVPPNATQQVLAGVLGRIDIYLIWHLVLLIAGIAAFTSLSRKKALLSALGIWVLLTLLSLLPTFIGFGQGMRLF